MERIRALAGDFDPGRDLSGPQSSAFQLLASAPDDGTSYFVWGDSGGGMSEPHPRVLAIWALWTSERAERAFAALFLASVQGSSGQFAALIGLRHSMPASFEDAAQHFEHTGVHFRLFELPSDFMSGAPWGESRPDALGEYIDTLRLAEFKSRWESQVAAAKDR